MYVFNRAEHPMIVFDRQGNVLRSWGEGQYRRPHGARRNRSFSSADASLASPCPAVGRVGQVRYFPCKCGRVRLSSDLSEIKLVFSIPAHRPTPNRSARPSSLRSSPPEAEVS
jgi:hypothetical protein